MSKPLIWREPASAQTGCSQNETYSMASATRLLIPRVAFPAACGAHRSRQRDRRLAHPDGDGSPPRIPRPLGRGSLLAFLFKVLLSWRELKSFYGGTPRSYPPTGRAAFHYILPLSTPDPGKSHAFMLHQRDTVVPHQVEHHLVHAGKLLAEGRPGRPGAASRALSSA